MPPFLHAINTCNKDMREYMFKQLGQIVSIIRQHARDYMQDIFSVIRVRGDALGSIEVMLFTHETTCKISSLSLG